MDYSNEWLRLRKAERDYFTCRYDFVQKEEEMVTNLKEALTNPGDRETALRLLLGMQPRVTLILPLLPEMVDIAVDTTGLDGIALTRDVLSNYKNEPQVKENIKTLVGNYLIGDDEWHFRRIAELYALLNYKEELADFLLSCQANNNWEIREIAGDFPRPQD